MYRPVELFIRCETYEEATDMYKKALHLLRDLESQGIMRSEIGHLDEREGYDMFMTRFGFDNYRIAYGTQYDYDRNKWLYHIKTIKESSDIDIEKFIRDYIDRENNPVDIIDENYKINISVMIPDKYEKMFGSTCKDFSDGLEAKNLHVLRSNNDIYLIDMKIENIARVLFYFGDRSCDNLLMSAYSGEIMTCARFMQVYKKIITRILRIRNRITRALKWPW